MSQKYEMVIQCKGGTGIVIQLESKDQCDMFYKNFVEQMESYGDYRDRERCIYITKNGFISLARTKAEK